MKKFLSAISIFTAAVTLTVSCGSTQPESSQPVEGKEEEKVAVESGVFSRDEFIARVKSMAKAGDYSGALAEYDALSGSVKKKYASDFEMSLLKAQLLQVSGRLEDAEKQVDSLLKSYPKNEELKKMSFSIRKTLFMEKLSTELEKGSDESALALYEGLDEQLKDDFSINLIKASLLVGAGRYDDAEKECDHLDSIQEGSVDVLEIRLAIMDRKGDSKNRNAMLQKIIKKEEMLFLMLCLKRDI